VIQLTVLVAVHEQLVPVMTDTALVDPVEGTETLVGVTVGGAHCAEAVRAPSVARRTTRRQVFLMNLCSCEWCISRALKNREIQGFLLRSSSERSAEL